MGNITKTQITSVADDWRQIKAQIATLEKQRKETEATLRAYLNQHRITEVAGVKLIEVKPSEIADIEKLKSKYSEVWEQVKKTKSGYSYLKG